jgi:hypothetical protein
MCGFDHNSAELFCRAGDRSSGWREEASRDSDRDYLNHSNAFERSQAHVFPQARILRDHHQVYYARQGT